MNLLCEGHDLVSSPLRRFYPPFSFFGFLTYLAIYDRVPDYLTDLLEKDAKVIVQEDAVPANI